MFHDLEEHALEITVVVARGIVARGLAPAVLGEHVDACGDKHAGHHHVAARGGKVQQALAVQRVDGGEMRAFFGTLASQSSALQ